MPASNNGIKQVTIFGATGASGTALAEILSKDHPSWKILATTRSLENPSRLSKLNLPNVTMVECNPFNKQSVLAASKNCDILYCCIGFYKFKAKYWAKYWPMVVDNLLDAVTVTTDNDNTSSDKERKLVFADNIYAYGEGPIIVANGQRKIAPSTKTKPGVRAMIHHRFQQHIQQHPGTLSIIGASDFFGPHVTFTSFLGDASAGKIIQGSTPIVIGSATKIHDFAYLPDLSRAMAVASINDNAYNKFWICPHSVHNKTMAQILNDIAMKASNGNNKPTPVKPMVLGKCVVMALSPLVGFVREIKEMLHIWTKDYKVDDTAFVREFGMEATPYDDAIQALVDFYQQQQVQEK